MEGRMTDAKRRELELVAELVLAKADLKVMEEINLVRGELKSIPPLIDKKIMAYDDRQVSRRRWNTSTIIAAISLSFTAIGLMIAFWPK